MKTSKEHEFLIKKAPKESTKFSDRIKKGQT